LNDPLAFGIVYLVKHFKGFSKFGCHFNLDFNFLIFKKTIAMTTLANGKMELVGLRGTPSTII
jgi:hypothetical protein